MVAGNRSVNTGLAVADGPVVVPDKAGIVAVVPPDKDGVVNDGVVVVLPVRPEPTVPVPGGITPVVGVLGSPTPGEVTTPPVERVGLVPGAAIGVVAGPPVVTPGCVRPGTVVTGVVATGVGATTPGAVGVVTGVVTTVLGVKTGAAGVWTAIAGLGTTTTARFRK